MKKKRDKSKTSIFREIVIPAELNCNDAVIQKEFNNLQLADCFEKQQEIVLSLAEYLDDKNENQTKQAVAKLLTYLYLTINSKFAIRKTITRILSNGDSVVIVDSLTEHLRLLLENAKNNTDDSRTQKQNEVLNSVMLCIENFQPGFKAVASIGSEIFYFIIEVFQELILKLKSENGSVQATQDIYTYIHNTSRVMVSLIQKCDICLKNSELSNKLIQLCKEMILNDFISFETKSTCGLLLVYAFNKLPSTIIDKFEFKECPSLELLKCTLRDGFSLTTLGVENISNNYSAKMAVYYGILNVVSKSLLSSTQINGQEVITYLFQQLTDPRVLSSGKATQIVEISRTIQLLSRGLDDIPLTTLETLFKQGLDYIWIHLDHYIDTVRHATKTVLSNFVKLAYKHVVDGKDSLITMIFNDLSCLPISSSTRYIALVVLAANVNCTFLLLNLNLVRPCQMLESMMDQSIAHQVCVLYDYLMEKHLKELTLCMENYEVVWISEWVTIIFPYLKEKNPSTLCYQHLITSAFKMNKSVLNHILHFQFGSNPAQFGALLECLLAARKTGIEIRLGENNSPAKEDKTTKYWRGLIEYKTLEANMFHQDEEIRLLVLALIVESHKTTEIFTEWELSFMKKFLYYNITVQTPSTRKQIISLYKKALTRVKEGLAVINRKIKNYEAQHKILPSVTENGSDQSNGIINNRTAEKEQEIVVLETGSLKDELEQLCLEMNQLDLATERVSVCNDMYCREIYEYFLSHLLRECLVPGLIVDANYPRKSACLELLLFFQQSFPGKKWEHLWFDEDINNIVYNTVFDSYESNKEMCVALLKNFSPGKLQSTKAHTDHDFKKCITLASSIKPCSALSAAYLFEVILLSPHVLDVIKDYLGNTTDMVGIPVIDLIKLLMHELRKQIMTCELDVCKAAKSVSVYGCLYAIRHLIGKHDFEDHSKIWSSLMSELIQICFKIYSVVAPIVNNPSPEGHLPDGSDVICTGESDESAKAQALLVFAWRNVKEISLFFGEIASRAINYEQNFKLVPDNVLLSIGNYFVELFLATKHRGVFEQAYNGFCKLCECFWKSENSELNYLPKSWLDKMLNVLSDDMDENCDSLCATRRSAGLPFLILAILTTEPATNGTGNFQLCMKTLLKTANNLSLENEEKRTHCMNVLRAIYRNNLLGELVQTYVAEGVMVAITGFKSKTWGVRNSATLMYAALMTRMFGVQRTKDSDALSMKNRMTIKVFFMRYPELHQFMLRELSEELSNRNGMSLYPVLLILSRLYPSNFSADDSQSQFKVEYYIPFIEKCLADPVYRIRELAAKALVPLIPQNKIIINIVKLFILLMNVKLRNNELHGLLLQLVYLLKSVPQNHPELDVARLVEPSFWILVSAGRSVSFSAASVYVEALVLFMSAFPRSCAKTATFQALMEIVDWQLKTDIKIKNSAQEYIISLHYLKLYMTGTVLDYKNLLTMYAAQDIILKLIDGINGVKKFYLNLVNYLNSERPEYHTHALYVTEDLEISEKEHRVVVQALDNVAKESLLKYIHYNLRTTILENKESFFEDLDCRIPAFLVLRYYPCIIKNLQPFNQSTLEYLLKFCNCDNEELASAVISCISVFFKNLSVNALRRLKYGNFIQILMELASPESSVHCRLATCDFLLENKTLFCSRDTGFSVDELCDIWSIVLVLLEDDEQIVRDRISLLNTRCEKTTKFPAKIGLNIISERAREELLMVCMTVLPLADAIKFLVKWSIRHKPDYVYDDHSEVFSKGYLNLYSETTPVVKVTVKLLKELLWPLEDGLSYEDKSIFIEEKALLVTSTLLNAVRTPTPMVSRFTCIALLYTLKAIAQFLENYPINQPNFKSDFKKFLIKEQINGRFVKSLGKNDFNSLRIFFWTLYSPVLCS